MISPYRRRALDIRYGPWCTMRTYETNWGIGRWKSSKYWTVEVKTIHLFISNFSLPHTIFVHYTLSISFSLSLCSSLPVSPCYTIYFCSSASLYFCLISHLLSCCLLQIGDVSWYVRISGKVSLHPASRGPQLFSRDQCNQWKGKDKTRLD